MAVVYRVECPLCHQGPYRCLCGSDAQYHLRDMLYELHVGDSDHRAPCTHHSPHLYNAYVCGFTSLDALLRWFEDVMDELHAAGCVLVWYTVPDTDVVAVCDCQRSSGHELIRRGFVKDWMPLAGPAPC